MSNRIQSIFELVRSAPHKAPLALARLAVEAKAKPGYARNTIATLYAAALDLSEDDAANVVFREVTGSPSFRDALDEACADPAGYLDAANTIATEGELDELADAKVAALWHRAKLARDQKARANIKAALLPNEGEQYESRHDHVRLDPRDPKTWEPIPFRDEDSAHGADSPRSSPYASPDELAAVLDRCIPKDGRGFFAELFQPNPRAGEEGQPKTVPRMNDETYKALSVAMTDEARETQNLGTWTGPIARAAFRKVQIDRAKKAARARELGERLAAYLAQGDRFDAWRILNAARDGSVSTLTAIACNLGCSGDEAVEAAQAARGALYKALNP